MLPCFKWVRDKITEIIVCVIFSAKIYVGKETIILYSSSTIVSNDRYLSNFFSNVPLTRNTKTIKLSIAFLHLKCFVPWRLLFPLCSDKLLSPLICEHNDYIKDCIYHWFVNIF